MIITAGLLVYFWHATNNWRAPELQEGLLTTNLTRGGQWSLILVTFVLSVLYLPLSTIALHALVWSDDFWVVPNPYVNATTNPPIVPPLGPPDVFRGPLDFCYTTTMKRNELNFAPLVITLSSITLLFVSNIRFGIDSSQN